MQAALDSMATVKLDFPNNEMCVMTISEKIHPIVRFSNSISRLPLPIVVIHSEDDLVIPYFHFELVCKRNISRQSSDDFSIKDQRICSKKSRAKSTCCTIHYSSTFSRLWS